MKCISLETTAKTWLGSGGRLEFVITAIPRLLIHALYFVVKVRVCACFFPLESFGSRPDKHNLNTSDKICSQYSKNPLVDTLINHKIKYLK